MTRKCHVRFWSGGGVSDGSAHRNLGAPPLFLYCSHLDDPKHFVKGHLHFFLNYRFHFSPHFHKRFPPPLKLFYRK